MNNQELSQKLQKLHEQKKAALQEREAADPASTLALAAAPQPAVSLATYQPMQLDGATVLSRPSVVGSTVLGLQTIRNMAAKERLVQEARMALLNDQVDAVKRESHAYWLAKSAELSEVMNTYLQGHLLALETTRMDNLVRALDSATARITERLREIEAADYPDFLKQGLMEKAYQQYRVACDRIEGEVLHKRFSPKE